jgi:hypothetical protein
MLLFDVSCARIVIHKVLVHFELDHLELEGAIFELEIDCYRCQALIFCKNSFIRSSPIHLTHCLFIKFEGIEMKGFIFYKQLNGGIAAIVVIALIRVVERA